MLTEKDKNTRALLSGGLVSLVGLIGIMVFLLAVVGILIREVNDADQIVVVRKAYIIEEGTTSYKVVGAYGNGLTKEYDVDRELFDALKVGKRYDVQTEGIIPAKITRIVGYYVEVNEE